MFNAYNGDAVKYRYLFVFLLSGGGGGSKVLNIAVCSLIHGAE